MSETTPNKINREVSPKAIVDSNAKIADDVHVGPFCYIGPDVELCAGVTVEANATITGKTIIGENTRILPMAVIGHPPAESENAGRCIIGKRNVLREQITIYAGSDKDHPTIIGDDNLIMIASQVEHGAKLGDQNIFANCAMIGSQAHVEDYVRASAFCMIDDGVSVGAYCFIGPYASIDVDAPPFAMLMGAPYRVRGLNANNLTRCGFNLQDIRALKHAFRELYDSTTSRPNIEAFRRIESRQDMSPLVERLVNAVRKQISKEEASDHA